MNVHGEWTEQLAKKKCPLHNYNVHTPSGVVVQLHGGQVISENSEWTSKHAGMLYAGVRWTPEKKSQTMKKTDPPTAHTSAHMRPIHCNTAILSLLGVRLLAMNVVDGIWKTYCRQCRRHSHIWHVVICGGTERCPG